MNLDNWLIANKLSLTVSKTDFMLVTARQKPAFIDDVPSININNKAIRQVKSAKTLGLYIEETLFWSKHVEHIYKRVSPLLGLLKRIRNYVDQNTLTLFTRHFSCRTLITAALFGWAGQGCC